MADDKRARLILELDDSGPRSQIKRLSDDFEKMLSGAMSGGKLDLRQWDLAEKKAKAIAELMEEAASASNKIKAPGGFGSGSAGGSGRGGRSFGGGGSGSGGSSGDGGFAGLLGKLNPAVTAATAAAGFMAKTLLDAGARATEFSKKLSDGGGALDQNRKTRSETDKFTDALALSEVGTGVANAQANFAKMLEQEKFRNLVQDPSKLQNQLNSLQLRGDDKIELDRMFRDRAELEQDLTREQTALERGLFEQRRDLAIEGAKLEEDFYRKRRDLAKEETAATLEFTRSEEDSQIKRGRLEEDNSLKMQKFFEDFSGQQATAKYQEERRQKERDFTARQSDKLTDFQTKRSDRSADFARDRSRASEDYQFSLTEMALSGADAKSYLLASLRFQKDERRAGEDFATEQGREARDFSTEMGRDTRDFAFEQEDAARARSAELLQHEYERRYELIELTTEYSRALQDLTLETTRNREDRQIQLRDFADQRRDLSFDETMARTEYSNKVGDQQFAENKAREDFAISSFRQRRSSNEGLADFAGGLKNEYGELATGYLINNSGLTDFAKLYEQQAGFASGELTNMYSAQGLKNDADIVAAARRQNLMKQTQQGWREGGIFGAFTGLGKGIGQGLFGGFDPQQAIKEYGNPQVQSAYDAQRLYKPAAPAPNLSFNPFQAAAPTAQMSAAMPQFGGGMSSAPAPQINAPLTINAGLPNGFDQQLQAMQQRYAQEAAALVAQGQSQNMRNMLNLLQQTGDARIR